MSQASHPSSRSALEEFNLTSVQFSIILKHGFGLIWGHLAIYLAQSLSKMLPLRTLVI